MPNSRRVDPNRRAAVADKSTRGLKDLRSATKSGKAQQQLVLGGFQRRVFEQRLEGDEVARGERGADRALDIVRQPNRIHDPVEELGVADVELVTTEAGRLHAP